MLLGKKDNAGRACECCLVHGNVFYVFAFTSGAVDQSLMLFKRKDGVVLPPMSSAIGDMRVIEAGHASLK